MEIWRHNFFSSPFIAHDFINDLNILYTSYVNNVNVSNYSKNL